MHQGAARALRRGGFTLDLPIAEAFKLFTAEGEKLWVPGWAPQMLAPPPQDVGTIFLTGEGEEWTIWTVLQSDPAAGILRYSRVTPASRAGVVEVRLYGADDRTRVEVAYDLTALSAERTQDLQPYSAVNFAQMLLQWEALIGTFLKREGARRQLTESIV
jgi:hypothetical protein